MDTRLDGPFEPRKTEEGRYARWEAARLFRPEVHPEGQPWSLVIPPPNVTGSLHMGHALEQVMMDAVTRMRRMQGRRALYLPGVDHAGIATQNMVEAELRAEGLTRHDLGRERFLERTWAWKEKYHERIRSQIRRMGASCDWERERFTLDPRLSGAVRKVFVDLHARGLIYRAPRIINWCVRCRTALSDLEVKFEERGDTLYQVHYPLEGGGEGVIVATVRPETIFGDVAVAVNPDDERWRPLVGRRVVLPLVGSAIPVIADGYVDPAFGTGALKITPGHDPNDYEVGQRHGLSIPEILSPDGRLQNVPERFLGLEVGAARAAAVQELRAAGLIRHEEDYRHKVGRCQRCGTSVEPLVSTQWFVRMKPMAERVIAALGRGEMRFTPERWTKVFLDWLEGIRDWCVSRQLWWGHRIPAWHCEHCREFVVAAEDPGPCARCGGAHRQDEDVLDTWFSSGLWPFSTLGWPEATEDLRAFYPTTLLITGYDIIFFWVARMAMLGLEFTGKLPFETVAIHGLIRDEKGQKMSKTRGNVIDPMDLIDRHGVDPLRFGLASMTTQAQDFALAEERFEAAQHFLNKLWNAAKLLLKNTPESFEYRGVQAVRERLTAVERYFLGRVEDLARETTLAFDDVELAPIARSLQAFTWGEFCDWYLELAKLDFHGEDQGRRDAALQVGHTLLGDVLKLLHPIVPFVTEAIWEALPGRTGSISVAPWPSGHGLRASEEEARAVASFIEVVRAARSMRSDLNLPPSEKAALKVRGPASGVSALAPFEPAMRRLAGLESLEWLEPGAPRVPQAMFASVGDLEVYLPIRSEELLARELLRLRKDLERAGQTREKLARKLDNPQFLAKAQAEIVAKDRAALAEAETSIGRLQGRLERLSG